MNRVPRCALLVCICVLVVPGFYTSSLSVSSFSPYRERPLCVAWRKYGSYGTCFNLGLHSRCTERTEAFETRNSLATACVKPQLFNHKPFGARLCVTKEVLLNVTSRVGLSENVPPFPVNPLTLFFLNIIFNTVTVAVLAAAVVAIVIIIIINVSVVSLLPLRRRRSLLYACPSNLGTVALRRPLQKTVCEF